MDAMLNKDYDRAQVARERFTKHGLIKGNKRLYQVWARMKQRCMNPNCEDFKRYGARGITVCKKWISFEGFFEDMGGTYSPGLELDRRDGKRGYEPENVRWATEAEQNLNRSVVTFLEINGETKSLAEWATQSGLHQETIRGRFKRGIRGTGIISKKRLPRRTLSQRKSDEAEALRKGSTDKRTPSWKPMWASPEGAHTKSNLSG